MFLKVRQCIFRKHTVFSSENTLLENVYVVYKYDIDIRFVCLRSYVISLRFL